jgi:hypothetical protein
MSYISASVLFSYTNQPTQTASGSTDLITGSIYFNTLSGSAYIWNGNQFVSGFGTSGTSGTSGNSGTSGTSGTGFSTINNSSGSRLIVSDGTSNAATASSNLVFSSNRLEVTGSTHISGSSTTGLFINGLTTSSDSLNRLTYLAANGRIFYEISRYKIAIGNGLNLTYTVAHNLSSNDVQISMRDAGTGQIFYPSATAGTPPQYTATVIDTNNIDITFTSAPGTNAYTVVVSK